MQVFSAGMIYAIPSGANPTPIQLAVLREASWDPKQEKVALQSQFKAPLDYADGDQTHTIKVKFADFRASILQLLFGAITPTTGSVQPVIGETATIPTTPFQITVANGATFKEDAGVFDRNTGLWMTRGASASATQIYSVNTATGLYTYNTADAGHIVDAYYSYTASAIGKTSTYSNVVKGPSTGYLVRLYNPYKLRVAGTVTQVGVEFPLVHFDGLSLGFKAKDWTEYDLTGMASEDPATRKVFIAYTGE